MATYIVVERNSWGKGRTLAEAEKSYRKETGRSASVKAHRREIDTDEIGKVYIDDFGTLMVPRTAAGNAVGIRKLDVKGKVLPA